MVVDRMTNTDERPALTTRACHHYVCRYEKTPRAVFAEFYRVLACLTLCPDRLIDNTDRITKLEPCWYPRNTLLVHQKQSNLQFICDQTGWARADFHYLERVFTPIRSFLKIYQS